MSSAYSYDAPLSPHWGFPKNPLHDAGETITPHDFQKILYENLGFERSLDEVPMFLCERFCGSTGCSKDVLVERFNQREKSYNKGSKQPRDLKNILINLCLKIYSRRPYLMELEEENEYIMLAFHNHLFIKGCLLYTSPSPRDKRQSRMPSSA